VRNKTALILAALAWAEPASADEARFHATAGAAHAVGGTQQSEFGTGGGGSGTIELAVGNVMGVQASAGALVLSAGSAPSDGTVAKQSTGSAFLGTVAAAAGILLTIGFASPSQMPRWRGSRWPIFGRSWKHNARTTRSNGRRVS